MNSFSKILRTVAIYDLEWKLRPSVNLSGLRFGFVLPRSLPRWSMWTRVAFLPVAWPTKNAADSRAIASSSLTV